MPTPAPPSARVRSPSGLTLLVLALGLLSGCTTNAATGRRQFNMLSRSQEIAMGAQAMPEVLKQYGGRIDDPYMQSYVTEVGMKLAAQTEGDYASLPWQFTVLNSDVVNAFALPGGKVFITKGLLVKLDDEAELAGVLGHEIGHVAAEHADKQMSDQMIFAGVLVGASIGSSRSDSDLVRAGVPLLVGVGGEGFLLSYSRKDELEADALGMRYMARAGYDPAAQRDVMEILEKESKKSGSRRPLPFFSTHPYPETRIKKIDERLAHEYPPEMRAELVRNKERFQERVRSRIKK